MIRLRLLALLAIGMVLATSGAAQEPRLQDGSFGDEAATPGTGTPGDNDPRIDPEEVVAPTMDSTDPEWVPPYKWHEDPRSLDCDGRDACEDYKATEVAKEDAETTQTGAPK